MSRRRSLLRLSVSRGSVRRGLVDELLGYVEELPELITWRRGRSLAYGVGIMGEAGGVLSSKATTRSRADTSVS